MESAVRELEEKGRAAKAASRKLAFLSTEIKNKALLNIAEARIKIDKISADILCDLLRSNLLPEAYVPNKETSESRNILRQRMFFARVQTMVKNRIYTILARHPEMLSLAPDVSDLFEASGMK